MSLKKQTVVKFNSSEEGFDILDVIACIFNTGSSTKTVG